MTDPRQTFFFDGGCRPNPGRMEVAVVTRGQAFYRDDLGHGDNTYAEWLALLHALELAIAAGTSDLLLIGDSRVVIEQARGAWPCRSAHLRPCVAAFRAAATRVRHIRLRHVPRSKNLAGIALARRALP